MIDLLAQPPLPNWLEDITETEILQSRFPAQNILRDSLFYPSSGFDGDPVKHLGGNIFSFVYADYGYREHDLLRNLESGGFLGYRILAVRSLKTEEVFGHEWQPILKCQQTLEVFQHNRHIKQPFCSWIVFQRRYEFGDGHGPSRFSLLYLCAEGMTAYKYLYVDNSITPRVIAIIQPGHAFGFNWTDFTDPEQALYETVMSSPAGPPSYLLYGGTGRRNHFRSTCWPNYVDLICFFPKSYNGSIGLWKNRGFSK